MNWELLEQYRSLRQEASELKDRIQEVYSNALFPKSVQISAMPRASRYSNDGMIRIFEKIEELTEMYKKKQQELLEMCVQIELDIQKLPTSIERRIIRLRYLDGKQWSEIGQLTGYSVSNLHKIHAKMKS